MFITQIASSNEDPVSRAILHQHFAFKDHILEELSTVLYWTVAQNPSTSKQLMFSYSFASSIQEKIKLFSMF